MTPVLRCVPKSPRKEGESPFSGVVNGEAEGKIIRKAHKVSLGALKGTPTKVFQSKVSRHPLLGFVSSPKALLKEEEGLSHTHTKDCFNPIAYKLIERASCGFQNPTILGKVIEVKLHSLNETQKMFQERGGSIGVSKVGLGYTLLQPIKISERRNKKQSAV